MFIGGRSAESLSGSESVADDESFTFVETEADEDLGMSQHMMDSLVLGAGSQLENEEYLMAISRRLQTALEKMLMAITNTTDQVQAIHCCITLSNPPPTKYYLLCFISTFNT